MDEKTMKKISEMAKRRRKHNSRFMQVIAWIIALFAAGC
jgi:hypothetical protein